MPRARGTANWAKALRGLSGSIWSGAGQKPPAPKILAFTRYP
jgi:hypothetical protein